MNALQAGGTLAPIVPRSFEDVQRLAMMAVKSGLFKETKRKRYGQDASDDDDASDQDASIAKATMAIMQGLEVGLPPMQAIQQIAVINGRCAIWGDAIPALLWANGFKLNEWSEGDGDALTAHCTITRPDGTEITRTFSVDDAKRARLWDPRAKVVKRGRNNSTYETDNDSPWYRFGPRMLQMRARGFCWRDGAADVGRGLYVREELDEHEMRDITPAKEVPALPDIPDVPAVPDIPDIPDVDQSVPEQTGDDGIADADGFLAALDEDLACCADMETLVETWDARESVVERLARDKREIAYGHYSNHEKRIKAA